MAKLGFAVVATFTLVAAVWESLTELSAPHAVVAIVALACPYVPLLVEAIVEIARDRMEN